MPHRLDEMREERKRLKIVLRAKWALSGVKKKNSIHTQIQRKFLFFVYKKHNNEKGTKSIALKITFCHITNMFRPHQCNVE